MTALRSRAHGSLCLSRTGPTCSFSLIRHERCPMYSPEPIHRGVAKERAPFGGDMTSGPSQAPATAARYGHTCSICATASHSPPQLFFASPPTSRRSLAAAAAAGATMDGSPCT
eukprot:7389780-Prymnesium_polylepis.1